MSDRDALLATVLAHPDEDTPRLVYADWLDENGEPERAEFIRIQHRLPHLSRRTTEAKRLTARETELRAKLFEHLDRLPFAEITFRRGFVESVTSGLQIFAKHAPDLRAEDAPAYELVLECDPKDGEVWDRVGGSGRSLISSVAEREELRRCISLNPLVYLHEDTAGWLFGSPHLTGLRRLSAHGDAGNAFEELDSPTFANLRWLNLHGNDNVDHHPPEIGRLVNSAHLNNLEHLDLGACNLRDTCLREISTTPQLQRLRYLDVSYGRFWSEFTNFFKTNSLPALTELDLSDSIGWWDRSEVNECVKLLADSPRIERLTKLALRRNEITDEGARTLATSPRKLQLTHLDLWGNPIGKDAWLALEKRFGRGVRVYKRPADGRRR